ncbi:hypothetical protein EO98_08980 [Methanosarcina sp. 2.H.T.1A.6]|nr:hypothetical protein EO94_15365 [Methanosarcina sp. 2.H.T.1A.3]KKG15245.1 hypothetical protein EO97_14385 [Methanosarcina sp. 2.H.T.1A.15]KKG19591.1 hypothetical protein EO98_08980 [Methanosarcina sp. 2.H.T.1A.6]KKG26743.1 hypothetical protein EO96_02245 [Methanosarcina sp. 2.H.T.1A.8]
MGESSNLHSTGFITLSLTHTTIFAIHSRFYPALRRRTAAIQKRDERKIKASVVATKLWGVNMWIIPHT